MRRKLIMLIAKRKRLKIGINRLIGYVAGIEYAIAEYERLGDD